MAVRYLDNVVAQSLCNARNPQCVPVDYCCASTLLACHCKSATVSAAEGVSDTAAAALYKKKKTPPVPSGRYGASCVAYSDKLWMFAGTDGGYSKHGNGGYELGNFCLLSVKTCCNVTRLMLYILCVCTVVLLSQQLAGVHASLSTSGYCQHLSTSA